MSQANFDREGVAAPVGGGVNAALSRLRGCVAPPLTAWRHAVCDVDRVGRVTLPVDARCVASRASAGMTLRGHALLIHGSTKHREVSPVVDGRGRLLLPMWMRRIAGGTVLVAADVTKGIVLVAPAFAIDGLVDEFIRGLAGDG